MTQNRSDRRRQAKEKAREKAKAQKNLPINLQARQKEQKLFADAAQAAAEGRAPAAAQMLHRLLDDNPTHAGALQMLGLMALQNGDLIEAVTRLRAAAQETPKDAALLTNLAIALSSVGQEEEAEETLLQAIDTAVPFAPAHFNLGELLCRLGRADEAVEHLEKALALDPKDQRPAHILVPALLESQQPAKALDLARSLLEEDPEDNLTVQDLTYQVGLAAQALGRHQEAATAFAKLEDLPEAQLFLGNCLLELKLYPQALDAYRTAISLDQGLYAAAAKALSNLPDGAMPEARTDLRTLLLG
ncbi:tetratricopeptide repeat protein [Rhodovibrionaceae bacterium A322]